jgi:hypothetical protein
MFIFELIAIENLLSSYTARFRANPHAEGYLFNKDDFGEGVPCTTQQYKIYVNEFEDFIRSKVHFMWWWFLTIIIVSIIGLVVMINYFGDSSLQADDNTMESIGGILMILPLIFIFAEGFKLYKKPENELHILGEMGRERQSREEIMNRRYKGISINLIVFGLLLSGIGLYSDLSNFNGGYDSPYMKYYFGLIFAVFSWLGINKYQAHKVDEQILSNHQNIVMDIHALYRNDMDNGAAFEKKDSEVKEAYHDLVDAIVFGGDKSVLHEIIDQYNIPRRGEEAYNGIDKHSSYLHLLNEDYQSVAPSFLINLDWKEGVAEFQGWLNTSLKGTGYKANFPLVSSYPSNASILYGIESSNSLSKVFREHVLALNRVGLGLAFLETDADFFMLFIYKIEEELYIREQIANIGVFLGTPA